MRGSVFVGTSLDGYMARVDGTLDFLPDDPEPHGFDEFLASVDALVWGRKTYDFVQGYDGDWFFGDKPVFVLSASRPIGPALRGMPARPSEPPVTEVHLKATA